MAPPSANVARAVRDAPPAGAVPAVTVRAAALAALVVGVALRAWLLHRQVSPTESDEAVLALIALHMSRLHGHLMYWGQPYGGPVESVVAAPLLALVGPSVVATKLVGSGLCLGSAVLIWRIGRRTVGEHAGLLAAALFWIWPPYFVFYSTKMSIYFGSLFLALAAALALIRLATGGPGRWWPAWAGTVVGLAFWASPQTLFLLLPVGAALLPRLLPRWRTLLVAGPFVVLGAGPWIAYNARNGWPSLERLPTERDVSYLGRVAGVPQQIPLALGFRTFGTERWIVKPLALALLVLLAAAVVAVIAIRRPRWSFVGWALLLFPFAYAMSPLSVYSRGGSPRYFLMAMPLLALLVGRGLAWLGERTQPVLPVLALVAALAISIVNLRDVEHHHLGWFPGAPDALVPPGFGDLRRLLRDHDVRYAYADYWVSFRATFETGERTIVAPVQPWLDRYPPYSAKVAASPAPAYITLRASQVTPRVQQQLTEAGVEFETWSRGDFVLVQPMTNVAREELTAAYQLQPQP